MFLPFGFVSYVFRALQERTVSWRAQQSALAGWKRRFFGTFFSTLFWMVFSLANTAFRRTLALVQKPSLAS